MKTKLILYFTLILLVIFYLLSFLNFDEKKYNKYVETAFLNSKYLNTIDEITIKKNKDEFSLLKKNNVWIGKKYSNEFPVEQKFVEKSLNNLIKIRKMYKISDNINTYSSFNLDSSSCFEILCKNSDKICTQFYVGKSDFSNSKRFVLTSKSTVVFKTEANFEDLLQLETRFWNDPYIIPQNLYETSENVIQKISASTKNKSVSFSNKEVNSSDFKLLELRHGEITSETCNNQTELLMNVEYSNGKVLVMKFVPYTQDSYVIFYTDDISWKYSAFVSSWTYNRILETCGLNKE